MQATTTAGSAKQPARNTTETVTVMNQVDEKHINLALTGDPFRAQMALARTCIRRQESEDAVEALEEAVDIARTEAVAREDDGDLASARKSWRQFISAVMELAKLYSVGGHGLQQNTEYALYCLTEAADLGHRPAHLLMVSLIKAAVKAGQAERLFRKVVRRYGHCHTWERTCHPFPTQAYAIAMMYENGWGTPPNPQKAARYYAAALDGGVSQAKERLAALKNTDRDTTRKA